MIEVTLPEPRKRKRAKKKGGRRGLIGSVIVGSIIVHAVALVLFGLWIVAKKYKQPEATFRVTKKIIVPIQTPEHRMNMARHEAMVPAPTFQERLVSTRSTKIVLPELPTIDLEQMLPLDPSELVSDQVAAMATTAGAGVGKITVLSGSGGQSAGLRFFDIEDRARSVVIMIDVSASMFGRTGDYDYSTSKLVRKGKEQSFQTVREEAFKLVGSLSPATRFNIIHWSGSARVWKDELVRATDTNKAAAKEHIQTKVDANKARPRGGRPGGTRHDYALETLFGLEPETAFMLTDGNATKTVKGEGNRPIPNKDIFQQISSAKNGEKPLPRIHTLYYLTGADKKEEEKLLRGIATRTGGKFRKVKVEGLKKKRRR